MRKSTQHNGLLCEHTFSLVFSLAWAIKNNIEPFQPQTLGKELRI